MLTVLFALLAAVVCSPDFDATFTGRAMRVDYYHTGTATEEHISVDAFRIEGDWPGSRTRLVDDTNLGKYLFVVVDTETNAPIWSRGFASIYGEWETTGEARRVWKTFHETVRFPEPRKRVQLALKKRAPDGTFREMWSELVDPKSRFVDRSAVGTRGSSFALFENGPPATKVDLLVLGEGYTAGDTAKFKADMTRLCGVMFETEPFKSRRADFNVRGLFVPSAEAGISNPRKSVWRDSPFGLSFNAFDTDRYVLTCANARLREIAAQVPYDALILLFNDRKYGGGGIFNLWATCASDSSQAPYVFVHEFGHSFAGLADEYYTSQVAYEQFTPAGSEPWEPNVTALLDPAALKWRDLVDASTPLPTPWKQEVYDQLDVEYQKKRKAMIDQKATEETSEALMDEVKKTTDPMLKAEAHFGKVGAFQGAAYEAKGLYRPAVDCIMFSRNPGAFCPVCARAISRVIDLYAQ